MTAVDAIGHKISSVPQKVKQKAKIAAVALPLMFSTQSCCPWLFGPFYCPPPVPACPAPVGPGTIYPVPVPIVVPAPYCGPFFYGPCCDKTSVETAKQELDVLG